MPDIKFYKDTEGNVRQVPVAKLDRFKELFPNAVEASEDELHKVEMNKAADNEQKRLESTDINVSVPSVDIVEISGSGIGNPFSRKGMDGAIDIASQHHRSDPEVQFRARYGAYTDNPELHRDEDAPEKIERRRKKSWYEHIGAGGSAMGMYSTPQTPGEDYGEVGHEEATRTRLSQQYIDDRVSKKDKQREIDRVSDFLTNTQSGREFVEHDENLTKYFEELKPKLDIQIEELEQEIKDKASERNKIINRPVPGTRYGVKPSWLSQEERDKIAAAKQEDAKEADKIATSDDIRVASETLSELKRVRDAVNDRDSNAFVQLLKEGQRRLPEKAWSAVTLGLYEVAQQLEQRNTGELTSKADDLFAQHSEMVENLYKNPTTMAQDIANGTLHSAAFMVGMAFTGVPASFITKGAAKGLSRAILKEGTRRFITEGTKKGAGKVVRIAGKNIAEAFVQTVIMPSTWAGALEKNNEEPGSFLNAYAKNFIAAFGEVGLERAGDFMPFKFKSKFMQDVTRYTHMNSFLPEIIEEDLQTAWHALFRTGEGEWADLIDPRNRLVTAATIGLMQAPAMSIETVGGYAAGKYRNIKAQRQIKIGLDENVDNMQKVFGDKAENMMRKMDDYVDMVGEGGQKMPHLFLPKSEMSKLTEQQRDALATYTMAYGAMKGMERAKAEEKVSVRNRVKSLVNSNVNKHTGTIIMGNVPNIDTPVAIHGYIQFKPDGSIDHNKSGELFYTDTDGKQKVISSRHIDLVENADPAQIENEIAQQKEFEVERDYANSQVPLYQNGEQVRFTNQEGNVAMFGEIVGVDDAGSYLVQIEGVPQPVPVEPRQIIPENHLKGVENNSEVEYIDDAGKTVVGVVNDAFTLRGDGIMVIDGKEVSTDNIMGLAENIEDHTQSKETETTSDGEAVTETGIETTPEVETKTPEQLEAEKQQLAEQTRQQQEEHQKKEFYDTLPVYERGKNKGEFNVNKFTPEQKLKHFEYEVGKEATVKAAEIEIENAEKRLKAAETRYKNDPLNVQKRKDVDNAKAELDFYKQYVYDVRIEQTQQVKEASTSSIEADRQAVQQSRAEQEQAEKQAQLEREATEGVPDVTVDTAEAARNRGFRMVNGVRYDRQQATSPTNYVETERKFSDNDVVPVKRTIVEADQVHPSHRSGVRNNQFFITEAQPKERTDKASQIAADNIASNINPSEITEGVTAYTGAPIINTHGEVLQGNNRIIGLQQMYSDGNKTNAKVYKQHLVDNAADYGMTADQVQSMNNPVAVDIAEVSDAEAIRLGQLDAADTESGGIQRIQGKQSAISLGKDIARFSEIMFESSNEDAAISTVLDRTGKEALDFLLQKRIINPTQYESAFNKDGNITPEAKADLESIAAQMLFEGGNSNLEAMFDMLPSKAQKAILQTIHRNNSLAKGDRIIGDLQQAIEAYYLLEQHGEFKEARNYKEVSEATRAARNATSMFNSETNLPLQKYNNFSMELAMLFKSDTQRALRQRLNSLYNNIEGVGAELFTDATKLSKTEAIKKHFNNIDYVSDGQTHGTDVARDSRTGTEGQRDGARETERGERTEVRGESADSGRRVDTDNQQRGESRSQADVEKTNIERKRKQEIENLEKKVADEAKLKAYNETRAKQLKEIRTAVESTAKNLNTPLTINEKVGDVKREAGDSDALFKQKQQEKAWYNPNTGEVVINLFKAESIQDGIESVFHEVIGHKGIRELLGREKERRLFKDIFDVLPQDVKDAYYKKYGSEYAATAEYIAYLAQNESNHTPQERTTWQKVKDAVIDFIERNMNIKLTEQNVHDVINALIVESKRRLENLAQFESQKVEAKKSTSQSEYGSQNKIITKEQYAELRDKLQNKLNNLNTGFDPEIFTLGAQMAAYHIEAGAVEFKDFAQRMIADVGEAVRPYLKSFYEGARLTPGFENLSKQMDAHKDVVNADVDAIGNIKEKLEVDIPEGSIITSTGLMVAEGVKIKSGSFEIDGIDYDMYLRNGSRFIVLDQVVLYETEAKNVQDAIKEFTDRLNDNPGIKANVKGFVSKAKQRHVDLIESEKREQQEQREAEIREENKLEKDWEDALREEEALDKATAEQGALFGEKDTTGKIEDFGEVIEGAKKHTYERIEAKEGDIKSQPLSKTFPKPEYGKLVQEGVVSKKGAAVLKFYYDQIGRKPRNKYRLSRWVKQVQNLLDLYNIIIDDVSNGDAVYNKFINNTLLGEEFKNFVKLQEAFGFPENDVNMGAYRVISPSTVEVAKGSNKKWLLVKGNYIQAEASSIEGIVEKFNSIVNNNKKKGKDVKLDIYQDTVTKKYFIGRKTGGGVIRLVDGLTRDAAIKMRKEENAKLQELWQASRIKPEERRKANRERTGKDYRDGKNITPEKFEAEFGFRGVQFGNWVNNLERQEALNDAYDAFMDLANVIGVSPRALSLAGELGMAFGARGSGNAMAHYESGKVVINLTKTKGAGSLAHEWWHAMDNYFSRMRGRKGEFITSSPKQRIVGGKDGKAIYESKVRKEMHDAFVGVMDAIKQSELPKRSKELDKTRSAPYWATDVEMSARAFESYIVDKLAETGEQNDYLANFKEAPEFGKDTGLDAKAYPYPMGKENATINEAFNNLFEAMQEKQKGEDVILFREKQAEAIRFRESQDFRDGHTEPAMGYETFNEAAEESGNVTLSEIITGKQELVPGDFFDTRKATTRSGQQGYRGAILYGFNTKSGIESLEAIKSLQEKIEDGANPTELQAKVYRAIPNTVNVNELIDGDWITLSKDYAEKHGLARFGDGNYKIIEQNIPVNKIWWDGNDINELGYDVEENIRFRSAWHGSPHSFDKFSLNHVGKGEGSQAEGYGVYVSDVRAIGEHYAGMFQDGRPRLKVDGETKQVSDVSQGRFYPTDEYRSASELKAQIISDIKEDIDNRSRQIKALEADAGSQDWSRNIQRLKKRNTEALAQIYKFESQKWELDKGDKRNLYKVEIGGTKSFEEMRFIRWDKPVDKNSFNELIWEQAQKEGIGTIWKDKRIINKGNAAFSLNNTKETGEQVYRALQRTLGSDKAASEFLLKAGIDGTQFETSMQESGKESFNFVLFDENSVKIQEHIRFRESDQIIEVTPFRYGEGGTKGTFKGKDGTIYKSLQGGFLDWEDGRPVRRYRDLDTQEYIILKMLEDDSRFPQVGDRVETNEGAAFEIEKLERADNITFEEYVRIEEAIKELNSKGIYSNDFISVMRRPGTNEVVINDFSNGVYDASRIGNSYYNDVLFNRIEELLPEQEKAKLDKYKEDQRLEMYRKLFPDEDIKREDILFRQSDIPKLKEPFERVRANIENHISVKQNEVTNIDHDMSAEVKEKVLYGDIEDFGKYGRYEIVPVSNPILNIHNLNRGIYSLGSMLKPIQDLHSEGMLDTMLDYGYLNPGLVKSFSLLFNERIKPYEEALLKAKHLSTEAAQTEIMHIIKDIDYAKDYYERLAKDQSILRTEEAPRFRSVDSAGFYPNIESALENIQQEKGTVEQFKAMLMRNGAKQSEMDWMGWDDFAEGKKSITKAEIQEWIDQNRIEIEEVSKKDMHISNWVKEDSFTYIDIYPDVGIEDSDEFKSKLKELANQRADTENTHYEEHMWDTDLREEARDYASEILYDKIVQVSYSHPEFKGGQELVDYNMETDTFWHDGYEYSTLEEILEQNGQAKYSEYTQPGGQNYREVLLTMPHTNRGQFTSQHFDTPNIVAHVRLKDRVDINGSKVLYIEEIQSDWAQEGRKKGFAEKTDQRVKLNSIAEGYEYEKKGYYTEYDFNETPAQLYAVKKAGKGVLDMPFKNTDQWVNLALRRVMREAAEQGYDKVAWTTGEQQANLYDLSKHVKEIRTTLLNNGKYDVLAIGENNRDSNLGELSKNELADYVGKELAEKIVEDSKTKSNNTYSGLDLSVGGEGMKTFYNRIVPNQANKVAKPFKSRVEVITVEGLGKQLALPVTEQMRETVSEGMPLFRSADQTETKEFKNWFGDSKVVEESGKPLVVAHSTNTQFHKFSETQQNDAGWLGDGFYFFGDRSLDGQYGKNVMPVYLRIENPYFISESEYNELVEANDKKKSKDFTRNLIEDGYDGVYYNGNLNQEWVAFQSNQIKSATDNIGTFDAANDDIRFRSKEELAEQSEKAKATSLLRQEVDKVSWKFKTRFKEAWVDNFAQVKVLQDALEKSGVKIAEHNDFYLQATHIPGKIDARIEDYTNRYQKPLSKAIHDMQNKDITHRSIENYVMLHEGLVRNERMRREAIEGYDQANPKASENARARFIENLPDDYSGLKAIEAEVEMTAQEFIDKIEEEAGKEVISNLWKRINAATNYSLQKQYEAGFITKETYEKLKENDRYVPLRGHDDVTAEDVYNYPSSMGVYFENPMKRADGRVSRAKTPFAYIGQMAHSAIIQGVKNQHNQMLLRLSRLDNSGLLSNSRSWEVNMGTIENPVWMVESAPFDSDIDTYIQNQVNFEKRMHQLQEQGMARQSGSRSVDVGGLFIKPRQAEQHEIAVFENGVRHTVYVNANPAIARAINETNKWNVGQGRGFIEQILKVNRQMAANFTTRDVRFIFTNFARDTNMASTLIWAEQGFKQMVSFNKNLKPAFGTVKRHFTGKADLSNKNDAYFREFLMNGGMTGYYQLYELDRQAKKLEREAKKGDKRNAVDGVKSVFNAIDIMNEVIENTTRFASYMTAREAGKSVVQSVHAAKNVSVNFNQKGAGTSISKNAFEKALLSTAGLVVPSYLFSNANIQGMYRVYQATKGNPLKMGIAFGSYTLAGLLAPRGTSLLSKGYIKAAEAGLSVAALAWIAPILANAIGGDDGEEEYMKVGEWDRQNNFTLMLPSGSFIKYPISHEFRVWYKLGDHIYQLATGREEPERAMTEMMYAVSDLLPMDPLNALDASAAELAPDFMRPFAQLMTNTDFKGSSIYNEWANPDVPGYLNTKTNKKGEPLAPELLVRFLKGIDHMTGGDGVAKGWASPNPDITHHFMRGFAGGLYTNIMQGMSIGFEAYNAANGKGFNLKAKDTPARAFYTSKDDLRFDSGTVGREYYDIMKKVRKERGKAKRYKDQYLNADISLQDYVEKIQGLDLKTIDEQHKMIQRIKKMESELIDLQGKEQKDKELEIYQKKKELVELTK